ncbi:MAG: hypothetical protein MZV70_11570 [Desulfobacterales bacterium]|nr:hypothetical protein [Desulfobacterales bacterium]
MDIMKINEIENIYLAMTLMLVLIAIQRIKPNFFKVEPSQKQDFKEEIKDLPSQLAQRDANFKSIYKGEVNPQFNMLLTRCKKLRKLLLWLKQNPITSKILKIIQYQTILLMNLHF